MLLIIEIIIFTYLAGCVFFNFFFSVAGKLARRKKNIVQPPPSYQRIAILVPAYKEDEVILSAAESYSHLNYPKAYYDTVVIADSLRPETLEALRGPGVRVIPVSFDVSTKAKSLNTAFEQLEDRYDLALICDADNVLEKDFLLKVNQAWLEGKEVLQAQRVAKNMDTPFAILDAANEIVANHIHRKGANAVGLSAPVIGSGMVFPFAFVKSVLKDIQAIGGFDKVLQLLVVAHGKKIHYLENALVFDEKVENPNAFRNQRRRWISAQIVYLRKFFAPGMKALFRGQIDYFNLAVIQNMLMPRMLLLVAVGFFTLVYLLFSPYLGIPAAAWLIIMAMFIISLLLPLPKKFYTTYFFTAMMALPRVLGIMVALMFRLKGANKTFIHTKHTKTGIDNPLLDGNAN
ncbi:glycosyltransferase [Chitinophaga lutea]|uniref:Glycosyltransferase n=1 Tax=Chitinophaga lutea TaxID=2488634 RepID=A0A3N4PXG1_9BACT|nr:glycosyltransferase [Chitinophaga lutea]